MPLQNQAVPPCYKKFVFSRFPISCTVSDATHGFNVFSTFAQLLPQVPNMYVHRSAFPVKCISPDMIQQPITSKDHALMFQQQTQQFKFFQRQANGFFAHSDNVTGRVHIQITQYILLLLFARSRQQQNRIETGNPSHQDKR